MTNETGFRISNLKNILITNKVLRKNAVKDASTVVEASNNTESMNNFGKNPECLGCTNRDPEYCKTKCLRVEQIYV